MECPICYETSATCKTLLCGHEFCSKCSKEWFFKAADHPKCPMCRRPFWFRGLSSSSWLKEKTETSGQDEIDRVFSEMFEEFLEAASDDFDLNEEVLPVLAEMQSTYNSLIHLYDIDPESAYYIVATDSSLYLSWSRRYSKWVYFDEPVIADIVPYIKVVKRNIIRYGPDIVQV